MLLDVPSFGHRFEIVLRRLGCKYSYCDSAVLDNDTLHARRDEQSFVQQKMRTVKMKELLGKQQEANQLYLNIQNLDIQKSPDEDNFLRYLEGMERICDLLDLCVVVP